MRSLLFLLFFFLSLPGCLAFSLPCFFPPPCLLIFYCFASFQHLGILRFCNFISLTALASWAFPVLFLSLPWHLLPLPFCFFSPRRLLLLLSCFFSPSWHLVLLMFCFFSPSWLLVFLLFCFFHCLGVFSFCCFSFDRLGILRICCFVSAIICRSKRNSPKGLKRKRKNSSQRRCDRKWKIEFAD